MKMFVAMFMAIICAVLVIVEAVWFINTQIERNASDADQHAREMNSRHHH